jgi:photosystem II stability/assembly factor-like uncharacterized protein
MFPDLTETLGVVEPHLYAVAIPSAACAWIVGELGIVLKSADGGMTWSLQRGGAMDNAMLSGVAFRNCQQGFAAGQAGLVLVTDDGGAHWRAENLGEKDFYGVGFASDGRGVIFGDGGFLWVSADAGLTGWQPVRMSRPGGGPVQWVSAGVADAKGRFIVAGQGHVGPFVLPEDSLLSAGVASRTPWTERLAAGREAGETQLVKE